MQRKYLAVTAISGFITVVLGAFGAHGLKAMLSPADLAIWQTAVQYQMFHTLVLLAIALSVQQLGRRLSAYSGWLFGLGIVLFSGSLYVMAVTGIRQLGMVTPLGGLAFLCGWGLLAVAALKRRQKI